MRIAMISEVWEPIWGGGQAHVLELSKKLVANHGCEIDIFTMNFLDENGNSQPKISELKNGKIRIIRTGKIRSFNFRDRIFWMFELVRAVKKNHRERKYDVIHAHANLPGIPGKILSELLKIPVIYTVHGSGVESMYSMYGKNIKSFIMLQLEDFLHRKIKYSKEISVDRRILKSKNRNKNVSVISNGVDMEKYDSISWPEVNVFKIIFVGRLHTQKGIDYLLDAINKIKKKLPLTCELHIIGDGELKHHLENKIKKYGIEKIVKLRGKISGMKLVNEYKSSQLFILPSLFEGQPLTLLEAWASRLPVIVTDVGDNKFFVQDGVNGYIIPPQDTDILSQQILEAMKNPNLKELGENGYALVKEKYNWENVAKKTYGIYTQII
ncbi:MAG: glycosyltransferase family 4 protein [Candidatus Pacebacteria bacterium]|nr:glycosyltransferase family 4 protein [Candidatus Paceibacterota bacterium]